MNQIPGAFPPPPEPDARPGLSADSLRPIYPLDLDRVLQLTFSLYRFGWRQFILIGVVLYAPITVAMMLLQMATSGDLIRAQRAQLAALEGESVGFFDLAPPSIILFSLVTTFLVGALSFVYQGGLIDLTAAIYTGQRASGVASVRAALSRLASLIGAGLIVVIATFGVALVGIGLGVGLIVANVVNGALQPGLLVFAGLVVIVATFVVLVFVSVRLTFVIQAVMIEGRGARPSLGRSWRLIAGSGLRVLGYSIAFGLLIGAVGVIVTAAIELVLGSGLSTANGELTFDPVAYAISGVLSALVTIALIPIATIALTLLFYDVRFRRESVTEQQSQPRV